MASGSSEDPKLAGLAEWLLRPTLWGGVIGGVLGLFYGMHTLRFPGEWRLPFIVIAVAVSSCLVFFRQIQEGRSLRTLFALGRGALSPEPRSLARAAQEVAALPDRVFAHMLILWAVGSLGIGLIFCAYTGAPLVVAGRLLLIGLCMGPLAAVVSLLLLLVRGRTVIRRMADAGLPATELAAVLPPTRTQLRRRLVIFTAIAVFVPTVLVTDVSLSRASEAYETLLALPNPDAQRAFVDAHRAGVDSWATVALGACVVLLALINGYIAGGVLAQPLQEMAEEARRIARGELSEDRLVLCEDEPWAASTAFMEMEQQLASALRSLQHAGLRISSTTEQLVQSSQSSQSGAELQSSSLNETFSTTEELARSAAQMAENAAEVAKMTEQTLRAAQSGRHSAEQFSGSMARMKSDNEQIAESVVKLNKRVAQIGKVVEFIHEIADKSDLLALNAELEGTKAGAVGQGFSLVAAEMRRLAESVMRSTREIEKLIEEIRDSTHAAVMATEAGVKTTERGSAVAQQVSESLLEILHLASSTSESVRAISLATQQQQSSTGQLALAMGDILKVTQAGTEATKQILAANSDLLVLARELKGTVERFRIPAEEDGGAA